MKLTTRHQQSRRSAPFPQTGFTLPELLIAIAVFILLLSGLVSAHLFGLSMFRITETKLNATADARKLIGTMANEIRACKSVEVGNIKNGDFEGLLNGEAQQGTSLLIYPSEDTNTHIIYFIDPSDDTFRRTTSTTNSAVILAEQVTNNVVFQVRDHLGNILSNNMNNRVIHLNLEFYQASRYMQHADYYKLETAVTRRASE